MRIDKFICATTDYSRSDIKRLAKEGAIRIGELTISDVSTKIDTEINTIYIFNNPINNIKPRFFMLNKPLGVVCANSDGHHKTVIDLINEPKKIKLQIAGRLDKDTTGLVLITDDGQWNHRVTSPNRHSFKHYKVTLAEPLGNNLVEQFKNGLLLNGEAKKTREAKLSIIDNHHADLLISEGKYHQVKRMFAACGNHVTALHRHAIGNIQLDSTLNEGDYRPLTQDEVNFFND